MKNKNLQCYLDNVGNKCNKILYIITLIVMLERLEKYNLSNGICAWYVGTFVELVCFS